MLGTCSGPWLHLVFSLKQSSLSDLRTLSGLWFKCCDTARNLDGDVETKYLRLFHQRSRLVRFSLTAGLFFNKCSSVLRT
ncbi:hypothetical protein FHG87_015985 [Trinorchestia longiramus]|nr:hypothetical protein FHG87_015985 [Trinorchestia longiramus]